MLPELPHEDGGFGEGKWGGSPLRRIGIRTRFTRKADRSETQHGKQSPLANSERGRREEQHAFKGIFPGRQKPAFLADPRKPEAGVVRIRSCS